MHAAAGIAFGHVAGLLLVPSPAHRYAGCHVARCRLPFASESLKDNNARLFDELGEDHGGSLDLLEDAVSGVAEAFEAASEASKDFHDEQTHLLEDALLPAEYGVATMLTSDSVAIPALIEEDLFNLPSPKYARENAAFLVTAAAGTGVMMAASAMDYYTPGMPVLEVIQHLPNALWASYQNAVGAHPVAVKAGLTGVTYMLGDMIAQLVQQKQQIMLLELPPRSLRDNLLRMDIRRYARAGLVGLAFLGPLAHFYYEYVADNFGSWPTLCKIALDQTLYLAFYNTLYYLVLGQLAGRPLSEVAAQYSEQFWQLLTAGWKLWPFVGLITYTFVPTEHRVLFVDAIEIAYSAILSQLTSDSHGEVS